MESRPKLKIQLTKTDRILEGLGYFTIVASWGLVVFVYPILPQSIPTHFGFSGVADGFGDKTYLLLLPGIATVLFTGISILNRLPHIFNYPVAITESNALKQYTYATRLLRFLKFSVPLIFLTIFVMSALTALHKASGLGFWFLPTALVFIFLPLVFYSLKLIRNA